MQAPGQVQQGSGEGSGEGLGGFGAGQVRFNRVPAKVWEVRFKRVPKNSGEGLGGFVRLNGFRRRLQSRSRRRFWESLVQGQVRFNGFRRRFRRRLREGSREVCFSSFCFLGFAACFRKICKNKMLRLLLLGIPPKLISIRKRFVLKPPHFQEPAFDTSNANLIR